jgi:hypothetical protein
VPLRRTREAAFASVLQQVAGEVVAPFPELAQLRLVVELAPPELPLEATGLVGDGSPAAQVPLARAVPGDAPLLVVYRRPVELRAEDRDGLAELLHEVVVEGVAELLGVNPEEVDPGQR